MEFWYSNLQRAHQRDVLGEKTPKSCKLTSGKISQYTDTKKPKYNDSVFIGNGEVYTGYEMNAKIFA